MSDNMVEMIHQLTASLYAQSQALVMMASAFKSKNMNNNDNYEKPNNMNNNTSCNVDDNEKNAILKRPTDNTLNNIIGSSFDNNNINNNFDNCGLLTVSTQSQTVALDFVLAHSSTALTHTCEIATFTLRMIPARCHDLQMMLSNAIKFACESLQDYEHIVMKAASAPSAVPSPLFPAAAVLDSFCDNLKKKQLDPCAKEFVPKQTLNIERRIECVVPQCTTRQLEDFVEFNGELFCENHIPSDEIIVFQSLSV